MRKKGVAICMHTTSSRYHNNILARRAWSRIWGHALRPGSRIQMLQPQPKMPSTAYYQHSDGEARYMLLAQRRSDLNLFIHRHKGAVTLSKRSQDAAI